MERQLLRINEAAAAIGFGRTKTYELINRGLLEAVLVDGELRVPVGAVEAFVQRLQKESKFVPSGGEVERRRSPRSSDLQSLTEWIEDAYNETPQGRVPIVMTIPALPGNRAWQARVVPNAVEVRHGDELSSAGVVVFT